MRDRRPRYGPAFDRAVALCLGALVLGALAGAGRSSLAADDLQGSSPQVRGDFVVVDWQRVPGAEIEATTALRLAEQWAPRIEELVFGRRIETRRLIEIRLNGDARIGNPPTYRVPHVTGAGVVELYRYGQSHLAALPHELVHAVLRREGVPYGRFDEEGVAGYVGYLLRPSFPGFPVYGHPLDVIVGHWTATGRGIPLAALRARHRELNLKCSFQSYAMRTSFFLYLGERFGAPTIRGFVDLMGAADGYRRAFGEDLVELESAWSATVRAGFERRADRDEIIASYLSQPAIANAYVCLPGRDF